MVYIYLPAKTEFLSGGADDGIQVGDIATVLGHLGRDNYDILVNGADDFALATFTDGKMGGAEDEMEFKCQPMNPGGNLNQNKEMEIA